MRYIGITALCALLWLSAPAKAEIVVNISKSQQRLAVSVDGTELYRWPVSTGRRGHVTPSGTFHPIRLERHWYSRQYELTPMPWAMFFFRGYAVHGTMEAYNLGHVASHGCVRLRPDHAATLFSLVHKRKLSDTRIVVRDGPLPPMPGAVPMAEASPDAKRAKAADAVAEQRAGAPDGRRRRRCRRQRQGASRSRGAARQRCRGYPRRARTCGIAAARANARRRCKWRAATRPRCCARGKPGSTAWRTNTVSKTGSANFRC